MADYEYSGLPSKAVVGTIARDTTNRPSKLRLKATSPMSHESTIGGNGERKVKGSRAR